MKRRVAGWREKRMPHSWNLGIYTHSECHATRGWKGGNKIWEMGVRANKRGSSVMKIKFGFAAAPNFRPLLRSLSLARLSFVRQSELHKLTALIYTCTRTLSLKRSHSTNQLTFAGASETEWGARRALPVQHFHTYYCTRQLLLLYIPPTSSPTLLSLWNINVNPRRARAPVYIYRLNYPLWWLHAQFYLNPFAYKLYLKNGYLSPHTRIVISSHIMMWQNSLLFFLLFFLFLEFCFSKQHSVAVYSTRMRDFDIHLYITEGISSPRAPPKGIAVKLFA